VARVPNDYKSDLKPVWCPGCGDFGVVNALAKAMAKLASKPQDVAVVSGIGCSSRIPAYLASYGFHGVHGPRARRRHRSQGRASRSHRDRRGGDGDGTRLAAITSCTPAAATST